MKKIPLTQGKFALVDDEDYEELVKWKWYAMKSGKTFYAGRSNPKKPFEKRKASIRMHRQLTSPVEGMEVDHVNGNGLDNRRENLRVCSRNENQHNRPLQKNNSSGYKGVYFDTRNKKWKAQISVNSRNRAIGYFSTPEEAHTAYCEAAKKHHGEFSNTG